MPQIFCSTSGENYSLRRSLSNIMCVYNFIENSAWDADFKLLLMAHLNKNTVDFGARAADYEQVKQLLLIWMVQNSGLLTFSLCRI